MEESRRGQRRGAEEREHSVDMCFCQPGSSSCHHLLSDAIHHKVPVS